MCVGHKGKLKTAPRRFIEIKKTKT